MARFTQDIVLNKPDDFVYFIMNDYLQKNGFTMSDWKGEPAYRAGDAIMEGFKYLKWSYANGTFHLEAWLKGTFGGEWDLEGFVGIAMKKPYKNNLMELIKVLQQPLPEGATNMQNTASDGSSNGNTTAQANASNPIPVQTVDNHQAATQGFVLGILSIVFCFWPIVCICLAVIGLSRCRMGQGSSKAKQAKTGKVLCIVGASIMAALWLLNLVLTMLTIVI